MSIYNLTFFVKCTRHYSVHSSHLFTMNNLFHLTCPRVMHINGKDFYEEYVPMLVKLDILIKKCVWSINYPCMFIHYSTILFVLALHTQKETNKFYIVSLILQISPTLCQLRYHILYYISVTLFWLINYFLISLHKMTMGIGYWLIKKYFIILLIFNHGFLPRSKSRDSIIDFKK